MNYTDDISEIVNIQHKSFNRQKMSTEKFMVKILKLMIEFGIFYNHKLSYKIKYLKEFNNLTAQDMYSQLPFLTGPAKGDCLNEWTKIVDTARVGRDDLTNLRTYQIRYLNTLHKKYSGKASQE